VTKPTILAPEMFNNMSMSAKTDCWSLGIILFEMLTGQLPYIQENILDLIDKMNQDINLNNYPAMSDVSYQARHLLSHFLQKEPSKRISAVYALNHPWFDDVSK